MHLRRLPVGKKDEYSARRDMRSQALRVRLRGHDLRPLRDYGCETLKGFFAFAPVLKDKLEAIRKEIEK